MKVLITGAQGKVERAATKALADADGRPLAG